MKAWEKVVQSCEEIAALQASLNLSSWDQETYMPAGGIEKRSKQMSVLSGIRHKMLLNELIPALKEVDLSNLDGQDLKNYLVLKRDAEKSVKLPISFVEKLSEKVSKAQFIWDQAKKSSDFSAFAPHLETLVHLKKEEADYYGYETEAYDALLDAFEPGLKAEWFANLFSNFIPKLQHLFQEFKSNDQISTEIHSDISFERQMMFLNEICQKIGLKKEYTRQDLSSHPFCQGIHPEDVRITTRLRKSDVLYGLYSSIHETGHAMYELGFNSKRWGMPEAEACSMAMHESQSRFWENNVARSTEFWEFAMPIFEEHFPELKTFAQHNAIFKMVNQVQAGLIRTEADELTYHFHVWIRFELERALFKNEIKVQDLAHIWAEKMKKYLDINVTKDSDGVLQDVHWSCGLFGYFPTYSLGTLYASQFHHYIKKENPEFNTWVSNGNFTPIQKWLTEKIWKHGRLVDAQEICRLATNEELNPDYFLTYIQEKLTK